jgi:SAM-dependent methyltransferase
VTSDFFKNAENKYDLIIAKDVLYYFSADELNVLLKNFKAALKKDGLLVAEIFNGSTLTGPFIKYKDIDIKLILTEHSLADALIHAGFKVKSISGNKFPITGIRSLIFSLVQTLWRVRLKIIYFLERGIDDQNPKILERKIIAAAQ